MRVSAWLGLMGVVVASCSLAAPPTENKMSASSLPPARDGDIAIQEELDAARRAATLEAYDLFLARHPQHRLAEIARWERRHLAQRLER